MDNVFIYTTERFQVENAFLNEINVEIDQNVSVDCMGNALPSIKYSHQHNRNL